MAKRRLTPARIAGIAAWTAASVTWGTAGVALVVTASEAEGPPDDPIAEPVVLAASVSTSLAPVPTMPEGGLVVLRYSPTAKPEAPVVVRRVVVAATSSSAASAPETTQAPAAPKVTKTKSSGS
jgi:hypothetical protein